MLVGRPHRRHRLGKSDRRRTVRDARRGRGRHRRDRARADRARAARRSREIARALRRSSSSPPTARWTAQRMRALVFADPARRQARSDPAPDDPRAKSSATHRARRAGPTCVLVVPLLFETGGYRELRAARAGGGLRPKSSRSQRVMQRSGLAERAGARDHGAQASRAAAAARGRRRDRQRRRPRRAAQPGRRAACPLPRTCANALTQFAADMRSRFIFASISAILPQLRRGRACTVITYEYPLNERIRTLLRLEDLFERVALLHRARTTRTTPRRAADAVRDPRGRRPRRPQVRPAAGTRAAEADAASAAQQSRRSPRRR